MGAVCVADMSDDAVFNPSATDMELKNSRSEESLTQAETSDMYDKHLAAALRKGDVDVLDQYIRKVKDVNAEYFGKSLLVWAVVHNNSRMVWNLIDAGANIDVRNERKGVPPNCTPLGHAAHHDSLDCARVLVEHGCQLDATCLNGYTPLMRACKNGNLQMAKLLIRAGCDLEHVVSPQAKRSYSTFFVKCPTAMLISCNRGHTKLVELLINSGCDLDYRNEMGEDALFIAVNSSELGSAKCVQLLLQADCDPDTRNDEDVCLVTVAFNGSQGKSNSKLELLLEEGCDHSPLPKNLLVCTNPASRKRTIRDACLLMDHGFEFDNQFSLRYWPEIGQYALRQIKNFETYAVRCFRADSMGFSDAVIEIIRRFVFKQDIIE